MPYFDPVFWGKIWKAIQRLLGALILLGFHQLLEFAFSLSFSEYEWLLKIVTEVLLVVFLIIYFALLIDTVFIFIPKRKPRRRERHVRQNA